MKRIFFVFVLMAYAISPILSCTSAIIGADMNPYGRPLLWKNRDTSAFDNKIEYIKGDKDNFSYVALFNASDSLLSEAWMGMNEYGFAVMNTASYNLKDDDIPQKEMDKEGLIMSKALKRCKTVDDFANFLGTISKPMGVEANFGAIDAYGNGAYFETDNFNFKRFNLVDSPDHVLVRTNYSHSGRENEGFGFVREANANCLLEPYIKTKSITPEVFTEELSRSFYHDLFKKDFAQSEDNWIIDQDFIPRFTSTASIVIEGCEPLSYDENLDPGYITDEYVMWTALGYPPCADIIPVWCSETGVDTSLSTDAETGRSRQCDLVLKRKAEVFPITKGNGNKYIYLPALVGEEGEGYLNKLAKKNKETYSQTRARSRNVGRNY